MHGDGRPTLVQRSPTPTNGTPPTSATHRTTQTNQTTNQQVQHFHYEEETSPIFQLETFGFRTGARVMVLVPGDGWLVGWVDRSVLDGGMDVSALLDDKASVTP